MMDCPALSPAARERPLPRLQPLQHPTPHLMSASIVPHTGDRLACRPDASSTIIQNLGSFFGPLAPSDPENVELQFTFHDEIPQCQAQPLHFPDFADECTLKQQQQPEFLLQFATF